MAGCLWRNTERDPSLTWALGAFVCGHRIILSVWLHSGRQGPLVASRLAGESQTGVDLALTPSVPRAGITRHLPSRTGHDGGGGLGGWRALSPAQCLEHLLVKRVKAMLQTCFCDNPVSHPQLTSPRSRLAQLSQALRGLLPMARSTGSTMAGGGPSRAVPGAITQRKTGAGPGSYGRWSDASVEAAGSSFTLTAAVANDRHGERGSALHIGCERQGSGGPVSMTCWRPIRRPSEAAGTGEAAIVGELRFGSPVQHCEGPRCLEDGTWRGVPRKCKGSCRSTQP